ncbi:lysophospholipase, putative [Plasmodium knowlesi strain H]|uniref:Lysophospholipase, putative n=3 Tax=Plasmodium knowlesi TaxID=5850 RepID=A0A5K1U3Y2_PLAKH|nr:lysophospholipase, putative [Plasmodium knowlesi strain H]OTN68624.1 putative Lysophospholipase [Plasmodium knowlesi]CAA9986163.1 lysophospholipase, putative [Plasmodium knowlesi strain H]SBO25354.1 lysophospholipase, putative [Plasmodium knowlesi strain H]SBO27658.1 lysophospholipase, putative [Plasmodium knowlesi strain H]VVS75637.1 lysophospholipase, putative [Plasmodium knowlesi strain H]|eukprot:XP_002257574.1 lysophospholipase-like protein [Plasmodium knowlesi strain H]
MAEATNRGSNRGSHNRPGNRANNRGGNRAANRGANHSANRMANGVEKVTEKEIEKKNSSIESAKKISNETEKATSQPAKETPNKLADKVAKETPNKLADKVAKEPPKEDEKKAADDSSKGTQNDILKTGSFKSRDGLELMTYEWVVDKPIGIIILVHALNSHVRFEYLKHNVIIESKEKAILKDADNYYIYKDSWIEHFNKNGYSVYGLDMRGHGQSGCVKNVKTHINNFQDIINDVVQYANIVYDSLCGQGEKKKERKKKTEGGGGVDKSIDVESSLTSTSDNDQTLQGTHITPGNSPSSTEQTPNGANNIRKNDIPPFYFMGLSMGGNIVLRILELRDKKGDESIKRLNIKGVISLAGMISLDDLKKKPEYKYFYIPIAKIASALLPTMRLSPSLKFEMFPYINDLFSFDPHCYHKAITNRFGNEILKAVDTLHKDMKFIPEDVHILVVHSVLDSACSYTGVSKFFNALKTKNKELFTLEDMDHILPLEPGNEKILKKVMDWLSHLQCVKA